MKHSPLCTRQDGQEIHFTAKDDAGKYRFVISRELLDAACGNDASEAHRKEWVTAHMTEILSTRTGSGGANAPFNRILVEEIK